MLPEFYKFENLRIWKEQGFIIDKLPKILPKVIPKDVRKLLKEGNIEVDNYLWDFSQQTELNNIVEMMRSFVIEKVPKGEYNTSNFCDVKRKYVDCVEYRNWKRLLNKKQQFKSLVGRGYTIKATLRYIFNYLTIYENLSISEGLDYLNDYSSLNQQMEITDYKKFPKYLKSKHDILTSELADYKTQYDIKKFQEKVNVELNYEHERFINVKEEQIIDDNRTFYVRVPQHPDEIKMEGKSLNHCVGSYIKRVVEGKTQILFLRRKVDESLVTLEVRDNVLIQAKGLSNRSTTKEENKFIDMYAKEKELIVRVN